MDSVGLELGFDGMFALAEVNFGASEKFRPNGLRLGHN